MSSNSAARIKLMSFYWLNLSTRSDETIECPTNPTTSFGGLVADFKCQWVSDAHPMGF